MGGNRRSCSRKNSLLDTWYTQHRESVRQRAAAGPKGTRCTAGLARVGIGTLLDTRSKSLLTGWRQAACTRSGTSCILRRHSLDKRCLPGSSCTVTPVRDGVALSLRRTLYSWARRRGETTIRLPLGSSPRDMHGTRGSARLMESRTGALRGGTFGSTVYTHARRSSNPFGRSLRDTTHRRGSY